ncbi:MAG: NAD(P)-dependent dehydrogenase (short-subunit alcohol dehydrogenase family) [Granulosicoccus sp.]|jgi:NAD(P)-dependent dehydrogenase (short-subunit alcohol dehydrogenase family)
MRALITGAATGIGASAVAKLNATGYEVVALDIIEPANVDQWICVDISKTESIDKAVTQLSEKFDCMINVERVGRPGTADEIADLIVFLCSENSRWINGQDLVIDGGMSTMLQVDMLEL